MTRGLTVRCSLQAAFRALLDQQQQQLLERLDNAAVPPA